MAGDNNDDSKPQVPTIPSWQQALPPTSSQSKVEDEAGVATPETDLDPLQQARHFLRHEEVKDAPRDRKVAFLEKKGIQANEIQKVLAEEGIALADDASEDGMKTIHDSTASSPDTSIKASPTQTSTSSATTSTPAVGAATLTPKPDVAPVITYPEFLLKPQKPPPLVTVDRLVTATYIVAGVSALTWGASRYLVAPMLESLTSARRDLASSTLTSLHTLNTKLESTVSHVPYIPSLHAHKEPFDDTASITSSDSDPTELFHRDYGTQTSPPKSRSSSLSSTSSPLSASASQTARLFSLHTSLSSLLSSTNTTFSSDSLSTTISDMQSVVDRIESNSQPLYTSYDYKTSPAFNTNSPSSTSTSASRSKTGASGSEKESQSEAAKFKAEIRALKGAFLSSRNFPSAPRPPAMGATSASSGIGAGRYESVGI
ncbi:uncharacterized protein HMPREF1541_02353 [Cyphellophora europaea CBS 101466]|uniref:Peroxisomal membrane protein PEX14 n=1 Tax=Cyphellophora europaea (strain CBS 101466) TaxID=1220924 RepID=W2S5G6_CYPE1|nr:uncharacterized protein HMPREF1541_02353 [Cyphellophora europaea CBS 101466]ETN43194.1 hypothetical protein HMPREF1541_02353 [Cyphellophora europaea CBS 101466]